MPVHEEFLPFHSYCGTQCMKIYHLPLNCLFYNLLIGLLLFVFAAVYMQHQIALNVCAGRRCVRGSVGQNLNYKEEKIIKGAERSKREVSDMFLYPWSKKELCTIDPEAKEKVDICAVKAIFHSGRLK